MTVKNLSAKIALGLSQLNNMATGIDEPSTSEMFFGRTLRTLSTPLLEQKNNDRSEGGEIRQRKHDKRRYKSLSKRKPTKFVRRDRIVARDNKRNWMIFGTIIEPRKIKNMTEEYEKSYNILVDDGQYILWRSERYICFESHILLWDPTWTLELET